MHPNLTLTDKAARRIKALSHEANKPLKLRVMIDGGGCSGFQYILSMVETNDQDDIEIEHEGASMVIDPASLPLMNGSIVDYVEELIGSQFKILNPNATSACGCGISFSV